MTGKLKLILGPMFAGKTSELIKEYRRYTIQHSNRCLMIKFFQDTRYSFEKIVTHDGLEQPCISVNRLDNITTEQYDVIFIDEGHFFEDIVLFVKKNIDKIIIITALSGDYEMKPFENVSKLISLTNDLVFLKAVCRKCFDDANFTKRITDESKRIVIGGKDSYMAVCRKCF